MKNTHNYTVLKQSNLFQLVQRRKDHKKWYEIVYVANNSYTHFDDFNEFFGPDRLNNNYYYSPRWKYKRLTHAAQKYTWALLKWS